MFESGLDFSGWGLEEWLVAGGVLLVLLVIILIMFMKPGNKTVSEAPTKSEPPKEMPKMEPMKESKEMPKPEPVMEPKAVEAPLQEEEEIGPKKVVWAEDKEKPAETTNEEAVKKTVKEGPAKYHISQNKDTDAEHASEWRVRKEGSSKTIKYFKTQKEAIAFAEKLAENQDSSIVIHKKDGSIRKQDYTKK